MPVDPRPVPAKSAAADAVAPPAGSRRPHSAGISILPPGPVLRKRAKTVLAGVRLDLGVRSLLPEWRAMFAARGLKDDVVAALTVACVALPLSLAIALASDVPPEVGITTAIVAGIAVAIFGGQSLGVSGPAAAMAVLVGQIVDIHGLGGLLFVGIGCGVLQIATGALGVGRLMRLVPLSVVHGFTAGIGVLILIGQLPRAIGLPSPDESHVLDVVGHLAEYLVHANPMAALVSGAVVVTMVALPRKWPKIPAALIAVAVPTALVAAFEVDVPLLGAVPEGLPLPSLPAWPRNGVLALFGDIFAVYALASLESLLSASALDKVRGPSVTPHDSDQELVGQGIGNVASALFGGIPVTGVVARSALNVQAGAQTRRSAILHALVLIGFVYLVPGLVARMPIAALAGVLLATAIRMLSPKYLSELWHGSRVEAFVFLITVFAMVAFDLLAGVQLGIVAALVVALLRLSRARGELHPARNGSPHELVFSGPLTFLSTARLDEVRAELTGLDVSYGLVLDVRHVDSIDASAASSLVEMFRAWKARQASIAILGPNAELERRLVSLGGAQIAPAIARVEADLDGILGGSKSRSPEIAHRQLTRGVERFREEFRAQLSPLLDRLSAGQHPHTLFLTCADSRVSPSLITGARPGELFVVRNIGALLPPFGHATLNDEGAAIEYAIRALGVHNIVICGHSRCGAMTALREGAFEKLRDLPALAQWAEGSSVIAGDLASAPTLDDATRTCTVRQLDHLRSYPIVQRAIEAEELRIQAWFYDVESADVTEWDPETGLYVPVGMRDEATPSM